MAAPSAVLADSSSIVWNVDDGKAAYAHMINHVRAAVERDTGATRASVPMGNGRNLAVDTLNNDATSNFLIVTVMAGTLSVNLYVRESDLCVVSYTYTADDGKVWYVPLSMDSPVVPHNEIYDYNMGAESCITLARLGNVDLTQFTISPASLMQGIIDLRNPQGSTQAWARGMLRMIFAVSEGSRFRPLAGDIARNIDNHTDLTLGQRYVELVRNWSNISHVYVDHRNYGNSSTASTSTSNWGYIDTIQAATRLLLIALNDGSNPNSNDEL